MGVLISFQSSGYTFSESVALNIGPRNGMSMSHAWMKTAFGIVPEQVAFHSFIHFMALCICSSVVGLYSHFACTRLSPVGTIRGAVLLGKNDWCSSCPFSMLVRASLMILLMTGSLTCSVGILLLPPSIASPDIIWLAVHIPSSSIVSNHSDWCSSLVLHIADE